VKISSQEANQHNESLKFTPWDSPYIDEEVLIARLLTRLGLSPGDKLVIQHANGIQSNSLSFPEILGLERIREEVVKTVHRK
jgi:hypothetical protein